MRKILAIAAILAASLAAGAYSSPRMAARAMRQAIADGDLVAFNQHVDYPALRESMRALVAKDAPGAAIERSIGAIGAAVGDDEADGAVSEAAKTVSAAADKAYSALATAAVDVATNPRVVMALMAHGHHVDTDKPVGQPNADWSVVWRSPERFDIIAREARPEPGDDAQDPLIFEFRRAGLDWRLCAIHID